MHSDAPKSKTNDALAERRQNKLRKAAIPYFFIAPATLAIILLVIYPIFDGIYISFFNTNLVNKWKFVGVKYYIDALTDMEFLESLAKTFKFTFFVTAGHFIVGFMLASLCNRPLKGRTFFRGIFILPWLFPDVVVALLWKWIFNTMNGILNFMLENIGWISEPVEWLGTGQTAFAIVVLISIWKGYPLVMVQILAGMQTISQGLYEAAEIDGATPWQRFTHVTLPSLKPILTTVLILDTVWVFKQFTLIYTITAGGPGSSTMVSAIEIYKTAFSFFDFGYASAMSVFVLAICYLIGKIFRKVLKSDD